MIHTLKLFLIDIVIYNFIILGSLISIIYLHNEMTILEIIHQYSFLLIFVSLLVVIYKLYHYIKDWNYITMPYALKLLSQSKYENKDTNVYIDRFVRYDKKNQTIYYKNYNSIDISLYRDNQTEILHYLGLFNKSVEIDIQEHKRKYVKIRFYTLPYSYDFSITDFRPNFIFYGKSKDGNYYQHLSQQTTMITVGESGSGKSNFMNLLIYSLFLNMNKIDHIFMIDLKGVELSQYKYTDTTFIDNIQDVSTTFQKLKNIMYARYEQMKKNGDKKYKGLPIFCIIDEVGTIGTYHDKKLRDSIFNDMIELFQKSRACRITFLLFAQKIDSTNIPSNVLTNIQSRVLMKTDSEFNSNSTIGTKETIETITRVPIANFNRGRTIIKDGETSDKELIQVPFISDKQHKSLIKYFNHLI